MDAALEPKTFSENVKPIDLNNQCALCREPAGRRFKMAPDGAVTFTSRWLLSDARGFMVCNICSNAGLRIVKQKLNKSQKRKAKAMRREMAKMVNLPHVTLDSHGKQV